MPALTSTQTWLQAAAVAAVTAGILIGLPLLSGPSDGSPGHGEGSPVVAAAWAQLHCHPTLKLRSDTLVTDRDILLEGAATFEAQRELLGLGPACTRALKIAQPVIDGSRVAMGNEIQPLDRVQSLLAIAAN